MTKIKEYSLEYWVKKIMCADTSDPTQPIIKAIETYKANGNHHPEVAYEGSPVDFAHAIYLEYFKRGGAWQGFYPTPRRLADDMIERLNLKEGQVVLDAGCGFGALSAAIERQRAVPIMVEYSHSVVQIALKLWGDRIIYRDFLEWTQYPYFDAVAVNPPFGNVFGHPTIEVDFMNRIADLSPRGLLVSALLPSRRPGTARRYRL